MTRVRMGNGMRWRIAGALCGALAAGLLAPDERESRGQSPAPSAPTCAAGQEKSVDTRGHCCWPGQAWSETRSVCVGVPTQCPATKEVSGESCACPKGATPDGDRCVTPPCPTGMVALEGGSFTMAERHDAVTVQPFCMDVTEVTADAYGACVRAGSCFAEGLACGPAATYGVSGKGNHPINCVDWEQSGLYCHAQGKRLPTEAEWEWAARGASQGRTYPWGNAAPSSQLCWSGVQKRDGTCPVGSFPEGDAPGGIHDLAGNVWEWTSSDFDATGATRAFRGGSWFNFAPSAMHAALRSWLTPTLRGNVVGFRCARRLSPESALSNRP
jgi:sulfatase modifying factor 1